MQKDRKSPLYIMKMGLWSGCRIREIIICMVIAVIIQLCTWMGVGMRGFGGMVLIIHISQKFNMDK